MATTAQVNINVNAGNSKETVGQISDDIQKANESAIPLKKQLKDITMQMQQLAAAGDTSSAKYQQLNRRAGELRDTIGDVNAQINATAGSPVENLGKGLGSALKIGVNGFQAVTAGMALFGSESEETQKVMMKLQAAMAFTQAITALGSMGDEIDNMKSAFNSFGKSAKAALQGVKAGIAATGIGVLLIAVGVLVSYWDDIKGAISGVSAEQKKLNELSKKDVEAAKERTSALEGSVAQLKLAGKSERDILLLKIKSYKQEIQKGDVQLENEKKTLKSQIEASRRNKAILEGFIMFLTMPIQMILGTIDEITEALEYLGVIEEATSLREDMTSWIAKQVFDPDEVAAKGEETIKEMEKAQLALKEKLAQAELDLKAIDENASNNRKAAAKKAAEDKAKTQEEADKKEEQRRQALVAQMDKDFQDNLALERAQAKSRIEIMTDEKQKQKEVLIQANKEYVEDFLEKRIDDEKKALDDQFISRQISEKDYNEKLAQLRLNSINTLSDQEKEILSNKKIELDNALLEIDKKSNEELLAQKRALRDKETELMAEGFDKQRALAFNAYQNDLDAFKVLLEEKKINQEEYNKLSILAEQRYNDKLKEIDKKAADEKFKEKQEEFKKVAKEVQMWGDATMAIVNAINEAQNQRTATRINQIAEEGKVEEEMLKSQLENRQITQAEYDALVKQDKIKQETETKKLQVQSFRRTKAINIANAIQAGALAVLNALATPALPPIPQILAGMAGAASAIQIGTIASQNFTAARGGIVPGNGSPDVDSVPAMLAPGEAVINARSASMFPQTLDLINRAGGGQNLLPSFAQDPKVSSGNVFNENKPEPVRAYVVETEITDTQKRVNRIKQSAEF